MDNNFTQLLRNLYTFSRQKVEQRVAQTELRNNILIALTKTLDKFIDGKQSPASLPLLLVHDLELPDLNLAYELSFICVCFHTAADLTDDVQDQAQDNPLINQIGAAPSLSIANYLIFLSQQLIGELTINKSLLVTVLDLFSKTGLTMSQGQFFDLLSTNRKHNYDPLLISEQKAGTEFACFMACLPLALGLPWQDYYQLGKAYGTLAQVFSDYFDIWGKFYSDDLSNLKNSLPLFAARQDKDLQSIIELEQAARHSLPKQQFDLRRILLLTSCIETFEKLCQQKKMEFAALWQKLPPLPSLQAAINEMLAGCFTLIDSLYEIREFVEQDQSLFAINEQFEQNNQKTIEIAQAYLNEREALKDSWEVQRWGFQGTKTLYGNLFTPALLLETNLELGKNINSELIELLKLRQSDGWHYYPDYQMIPTDTDDLGQLLNLVSRANLDNYRYLFADVLQLLEKNLEPSGMCPTWLCDSDKFKREEVERDWYGNECPGVMANLYYGLFLFAPQKYQQQIKEGINYLLGKFDQNTQKWHGNHYKSSYYIFYQLSRLLNAYSLAESPLQQAKQKVLDDQLLNGSWNNSAQDTAFAVLGLLTFATVDPHIIKKALIYLHLNQKYDGRWLGENLFVCPGKNDTFDYYRNDNVTTAFCLRAMVLATQKLNSISVSNFELTT